RIIHITTTTTNLPPHTTTDNPSPPSLAAVDLPTSTTCRRPLPSSMTISGAKAVIEVPREGIGFWQLE
nr:hypothetical protein [Tanacetum cinerariifolium]